MAEAQSFGTALKLGGVTKILFTPYSGYTKGDVTYTLDEIVADSTSISQEDPTTNSIDCETRDEPIYENIALGRITFTTSSGDIQSTLLEKVMGYKVDATNKVVAAPATYKEVWAEIEIVFGEKGSLVCPKVKVSGKIEASALKTGMVQGTINGTCYSVEMTDGPDKYLTPFYVKQPSAA